MFLTELRLYMSPVSPVFNKLAKCVHARAQQKVVANPGPVKNIDYKASTLSAMLEHLINYWEQIGTLEVLLNFIFRNMYCH